MSSSLISGKDPSESDGLLCRRVNSPCKSLDDVRHRIIRQVVEELAHRVDSQSALRTAGYNDAFAALGDARRGFDKARKIVALNLALDRGKQF